MPKIDKSTDQNNWRSGNKNAAKATADKRVAMTIRLPPDLIAKLKARGNVTAQIEQAIRDKLAKQ